MAEWAWAAAEAMAQKVLRIYIDDSGEKEYGTNTSRFFVYAGVVVDRAEEQRWRKPETTTVVDGGKHVGHLGHYDFITLRDWCRAMRPDAAAVEAAAIAASE